LIKHCNFSPQQGNKHILHFQFHLGLQQWPNEGGERMQMDNDDNTEQNQFFLDLQKQKDTGITVRILKNKFNSFQMVAKPLHGLSPPSIGD